MNIINKIKFLKKKYTPWFRRDFNRFIKLNGLNNDFIIKDNFPCLKDKFSNSGDIGNGGHYFFQDLFVASEIYKNKPRKHVDVGSRLDGFIAHLSVFREIEVFDIRYQNSKMKNVIFKQADLMKIDENYINYCDSISCLHSIEHFGLGRYGDEIDPLGHIKGFNSIRDILKDNGVFYFSAPMGLNRIEFNAHRIFSLAYLTEWVQKDFIIEKFCYIDDHFYLHENIQLDEINILNNCDCFHGCAIFVLRKR